jgi:hypothetical protein
LSLPLVSHAALAQSSAAMLVQGPSAATFSLLSPKPISSHNPLLPAAYKGIPLGDWMLYPTFFVGAIYDSNVFYSPNSPVSLVGARLRPTFLAERDAGIHKTSIYTDVEAKIFPSFSSANSLNAQVGFSHIWEIQRDLAVRVGGEYNHLIAPILPVGLIQIPTGALGTFVSQPTADRFSADLSVFKSFDRLFVGLAGSAIKTNYSDVYTTAGTLPQGILDNLVTTVTGRGGYWLIPAVYAFTEASGNFREYTGDIYNSNGYRVIGGLGSHYISLFKGEIYAGYQEQFYDKAFIGQASNPVFGGSISWFPTRALTVSASLDQTFTTASYVSINNPFGAPARLTSASLNLSYDFAREWSASWRGGYYHFVYIGSALRNDAYLMGATVTYNLYRNLGLTLDYSFMRLESNAPSSSFTRNTVSLGASYRY